MWGFLFATYLFDVSDPVFDVFKGLLVADVVDEHDALWEEKADACKLFLSTCQTW